MNTYDIDEAAAKLNIDRSTALELAGAGILPGAKIGRAWVFLEEDLVEYLREEVRKQMRERQAKAAIEAELKSATCRVEPMAMQVKKADRRKKRPDLSAYELPHSLGQSTGTQVTVAA